MKFLLIFLLTFIYGQDSIDIELDLDAMWENTIWIEIEDVVDVGYEVEKVTAVAGVRGAEAEDEALSLLYYRRSMKRLSLIDLQKVYGKLINKKKEMIMTGGNIKQINEYIIQVRKKIDNM